MSAASTARPVFEMGLSVAGKGGSPVEPILGGFSRFKAVFGHFLPFLGIFYIFFGVLRYTMAIVSNCHQHFGHL